MASASNSTSITTNVIWTEWNCTYSMSGDTSTSSSYVITGNAATSTNYVITNVVWSVWNEITEETTAERLARQEAARLRAQEQARILEVAQVGEARARELLLSHLSREQRQQFEKDKVFEVIGQNGLRRYRIHQSGAVKRIDEKQRELESFCIHPNPALKDHRIPVSDLILAKKLMLEFDEQEFLRTANMTPLRPTG